jgi:KaiC/GvpD/RAD55 family RecA-like ATPase
MNDRHRLKTHVSQTFWCDPAKNFSFDKAQLGLALAEPSKKKIRETTAWLDQMFDGGIVVPGGIAPIADGGESPGAVTILITGPPGTGKSTLAMELAYRWCTTDAWHAHNGMLERKPRILYVTNEGQSRWMMDNASELGWGDVDKVFQKCTVSEHAIRAGQTGILTLSSLAELKDVAERPKKGGFGSDSKDDLIKILAEMFKRKGKEPSIDLEVVVVDSLNTVAKPEDRAYLFDTFHRWASSGPRVLITVMDSSPANVIADVWEFACDIVIRMDRKYDPSGHTGYMVRTIEITKARYQKHVWGKHQLKIHEGTHFKENMLKEPPINDALASDRMRAHPYRTQGGIFVFPSIHYILSLYKRKAPTEGDEYIESPVPNLTQLLDKGYPKGRCTALMGLRGGHKSHLAYEELLWRIREHSTKTKTIQKALIVSLRDDEGMTKQTMRGILASSGVKEPEKELAELQRKGLLEITYYPPGYITPEEFFHRLLLSIKRLKTDEKIGNDRKQGQVSLLFNSLDQLSSRFPLCAKEPIFIPGIIQMLTAEDVSSFFVTARDEQSKGSYGLETMAELILEFDREKLEIDSYLAHVQNGLKITAEQEGALRSRLKASRQAVKLSVGRYAGGQAAGAEGILELVEAGKGHPLQSIVTEHDLIFLPAVSQRGSSPIEQKHH